VSNLEGVIMGGPRCRSRARGSAQIGAAGELAGRRRLVARRAWVGVAVVAVVAMGLIGVSGAGARPLRIDPLLLSPSTSYSQQAELTEPGSNSFGSSVAISGSTMAALGGGTLYVFSDSSGAWKPTASFTGDGFSTLDEPGTAVAISGSTIVAGAPGSNSGQGAAYVFSNTSGVWKQTAELTASNGAAGDAFGSSVAISGSTIVAGASGSDSGQGAIYVFSYSSPLWKQTVELTASDGAAEDALGTSVAISGSTIVAGAPAHKVGSTVDEGVAYVFSYSAGSWMQTGELTGSGSMLDGVSTPFGFGDVVAVSGTTIAVGAHGGGEALYVGAVYVFGYGGSGWTQTTELTEFSEGQSELSGGVAISGSTLVAGSIGTESSPNGAVFVFSNASGAWQPAATVTSTDATGGGAASAWMGESVGISGSAIVAGAPNQEDGGAAFVFGGAGEYTISGTVNNSCGCGELPGQTILVQGRASDGTEVAESAVSDDDGGWSVQVPPGTYTAGPTLDGETIGVPGWDPEKIPNINVTTQNVPGQDFYVCGAQPDESPALRAMRDGRGVLARPAAISPEYLYLCQAKYTFEASASIHESTFADPSQLAPYAVKSNGSGYRADNQDAGSEWAGELPECNEFNSERAHPKPLKWLSYYLGTKSLGTAKVALTYERYTKDLTPSVTTFPGSLTRVYEYNRGSGRCTVTRAVIPVVVPIITSPTTFQIAISWIIPFLPRGYSPPPDLKKLPGVATHVHELVDKAAEEVPLFKKLNGVAQAAVVYYVAKKIEEYSFHFIGHHYPSTETIVELVEGATELEKATNVAILIYNGVGYAGKKADVKLGYQPMTMVIRGKFVTVACPAISGTKIAKCNDTVLAEDVTTDKFPDYSLSLYRSGKGGVVTQVPNTSAPTKVVVVSGSDAGPLPGTSKSEIPESKGGTLDVAEIWREMRKPVTPGAVEFGAGATLDGLPSKPPSCNVSDDQSQYVSAGTSSTRCYGFQDGLP
jgi:FG-GAP repeat